MPSSADELRRRLVQRWPHLLPPGGADPRPPVFDGCTRAAERLRRRGEYRRAGLALVMPDPVLLQVRINLLADLGSLVAATPGLKQGLVRLSADQVPVARRSRDLRGGSLLQAGRQLRFPAARLGKVGLLVIAALAVDRRGLVLDDGRGLAALTLALLRRLGSWSPAGKVAVLADDSQVIDQVPPHRLAPAADLIVTPSQVITVDHPPQGELNLEDLPPELASLPVVKAVRSRGTAG